MNTDIENARQNHPELVVRDIVDIVRGRTFLTDSRLEYLAECVRYVLKWRGINKWLRVRRLLIKLKERWLARIHHFDDERATAKARAQETHHPKDWARYNYLRGYCKALHECRAQVRALCHSSRDVDVPKHPGVWGPLDVLPINFPNLPDKRWLKRRDESLRLDDLDEFGEQLLREMEAARERFRAAEQGVPGIVETAAGPMCERCGRGVRCWLAPDESPCRCPERETKGRPGNVPPVRL